MKKLVMHTPLSELKALQQLLAGDSGRKHQICSPLQFEKCNQARCCLKYELRDAATVVLAERDFKFCTPVEFGCQRMLSVSKEEGE